MKRKGISIILLVALHSIIHANNITVTNSSLPISGKNIATHTQLIGFDISWENSWRINTNQNNYDGAWIFVKFRKTATSDWRHCTINTTSFTAGGGSEIAPASDKVGAFIYRSSSNLGAGNVSFAGNKLQWNYGADGVLDNETVEIKVFALEMVYIPAGDFWVGTPGAETNSFQNGTSSDPFKITSNTITFGTANDNLNVAGGALPTGTIPANFPRGTNAFWIMKYECTQQQYVDFLNHLDIAKTAINMTGVFTGVHPNFIAPNRERVIGDLNFKRTSALADWSGLRPYSELEFEKVCRGPELPVANEFPWGNTRINLLANTSIINIGTDSEQVANITDSSNVVLWTGGVLYRAPVRAGLFARNSGATRQLSGAAYYGVMNMADNMLEVVINATSANGLLVNRNVHGNGMLDVNGESDITEWVNSNMYITRGASYSNSVIVAARTSDRTGFNINVITFNGIRLARTAQ